MIEDKKNGGRVFGRNVGEDGFRQGREKDFEGVVHVLVLMLVPCFCALWINFRVRGV